MAHTKAQGSVKTNKDSISKRLGVKKFGGQAVISGNIIVRQKGSHFHAGNGVSMGKDHTLYSIAAGNVAFKMQRGKKVVEVLNG